MTVGEWLNWLRSVPVTGCDVGLVYGSGLLPQYTIYLLFSFFTPLIQFFKFIFGFYSIILSNI